MNNFNRMTIRTEAGTCKVFKMKPKHQHAGSVSGGGARRTTWSAGSVPRFTGTYAECSAFIEREGAEFMSEHGLPV